MTDSEQVLADMRTMLYQAATSDRNPTAAVEDALRWFRCAADRGRGVKPGWGGKQLYVLVDPHDRDERYRRIVELRREGRANEEIAEEVHLSKGWVEHLVKRLGVE